MLMYSFMIFFFSSPDVSGCTLDVYHTSTQWCSLSANLECMSEMCCTRLAEKYRTQKIAKWDFQNVYFLRLRLSTTLNDKLECGPMPNVMAALPNIGGDLCSTPQSLADAQYWSAVQ